MKKLEKTKYDEIMDPIAEAAGKKLSEATQGIKDAYESTTTKIGQAVDEKTKDLKQMYEDLTKAEPARPELPVAKYKLADKMDSRINANPGTITKIIDSLGGRNEVGSQPAMDKMLRGPQDQSGMDRETIVEPINLPNMDMLTETDIIDRINKDPKYQQLPDNIRQQLINQTLKKRSQLKELRAKSAGDRSFLKFLTDEVKREFGK